MKDIFGSKKLKYENMTDRELLDEIIYRIHGNVPVKDRDALAKLVKETIDEYKSAFEALESVFNRSSMLEMLLEFQRNFNSNVGKFQMDASDDEIELRIALIAEEFEELKEALAVRDKVKILDALLDLEYVLLGTVVSLGFHPVFEKAFREVHKSNMSKLVELGTVGESHQLILDLDEKYGKGTYDFESSRSGEYVIVKRLSDGKILKPSGYTPVNLITFID